MSHLHIQVMSAHQASRHHIQHPENTSTNKMMAVA